MSSSSDEEEEEEEIDNCAGLSIGGGGAAAFVFLFLALDSVGLIGDATGRGEETLEHLGFFDLGRRESTLVEEVGTGSDVESESFRFLRVEVLAVD